MIKVTEFKVKHKRIFCSNRPKGLIKEHSLFEFWSLPYLYIFNGYIDSFGFKIFELSISFLLNTRKNKLVFIRALLSQFKSRFIFVCEIFEQ